MAQYNFTDGQSKPGLTADGIKWYQSCYVCNKQINFLRDTRGSWMSVEPYVRHIKCDPTALK